MIQRSNLPRQLTGSNDCAMIMIESCIFDAVGHPFTSRSTSPDQRLRLASAMAEKNPTFVIPDTPLPANTSRLVQDLWKQPAEDGNTKAAFLNDEGVEVSLPYGRGRLVLEQSSIWCLQPPGDPDDKKAHNGFIVDSTIHWCFEILKSLNLSSDTFFVEPHWVALVNRGDALVKMLPYFSSFDPARHRTLMFPVNVAPIH